MVDFEFVDDTDVEFVDDADVIFDESSISAVTAPSNNLTTVTPTWIMPINIGTEYFMDVSEAEARNKEFFLLSNTPNRQYELTFLGLSDGQQKQLLTQYRNVSGEYAPFYWQTISPQFYSLLGEDLSLVTANDLIGDNHLTVTGAISCKGYKGEGWGMEFDGVNDELMVAPSATSTVYNFDYADNFSISFKMKVPVEQADLNTFWNGLFAKYYTGDTAYPFLFDIINSNNVLNGEINFKRYDGTNNPTIYSTSRLNDNIWHHIVGVKNIVSGVSKLYLYIDASLESSTTDTTVSSTTNSRNLYFGARNQATPIRYFKGSIDDVRIYNIPLVSASIALLYAGTSTLTNCVAAWDFNDVSMYGRWIGQPESKIKARSWDTKLIFEKADGLILGPESSSSSSESSSSSSSESSSSSSDSSSSSSSQSSSSSSSQSSSSSSSQSSSSSSGGA